MWAVALGALATTAAAGGHDPFAPSTWAHWDSAHYESIAVDGYKLHPCAPGEANGGGVWCGNTAWFPAYPWAIAAIHALGVPLGVAALALAWFFAAAALVLISREFVQGTPRVAATLGLAFAALPPGAVYDYAVFPLSMFVAFSIACLGALRRGRLLLAGAAGFLAALSYPVGVVTIPAAAIAWAIMSRRGRAALVGLAGPAAFGLVVVVERVQAGRWSAFFDVQGQYGHGVHDPLGVTWNYVLELARASEPLARHHAAALQTVVVGVVVALLAVSAVARWRRLTRFDGLLLTWMGVAWAFPLTQANVSVWRSHAALAPVAALIPRLPRALAAIVVLLTIAVAVPVASYFFAGRLI